MTKKLNPPSVMIDIETQGTKPGSIITQISAVEFCPWTYKPSLSFNIHIDEESCKQAGLTADCDTLIWLRENQLDTKPESTTPLPEALKLFAGFLNLIEPSKYWCRGTSFDFPLLDAAYRACPDIAPPKWKYWQQYDLRTIWNTAYPKTRPSSAAHDALDDCHEQIKQLKKAIYNLRIEAT